MKLLSIPHRFFTSLFSRRILRTAVFVLMSAFVMGSFSTVKAQGLYLRGIVLSDTIGNFGTLYGLNDLRNNFFCLNTPYEFTLNLAVPRPSGMPSNVSWVTESLWTAVPGGLPGSGSVRWIFSGGIPAAKSITAWDPDEGEYTTWYDVVTFKFNGTPNDPANNNVRLGGRFAATWSGITEENTFEFRPPTFTMDTIFMDTVLCEGAQLKAWISRKRTLDAVDSGTSPQLEPFFDEMLYRWSLYDKENVRVGEKIGIGAAGREFEFLPFSASNHVKITVQRAFCNANQSVLPDVIEFPRPFVEEEGLIVVSDPPLDTSNLDNKSGDPNKWGVRQDTLYRLVWGMADYQVPNEDPDAPPGDLVTRHVNTWVPIPMRGDNVPACFNYDLPYIGMASGNVTPRLPSGFDASGNPNYATGYLFFQVGSDADTLVNYFWNYDTAVLERVYVGINARNDRTGAYNINWFLDLTDERWTTRTYYSGMEQEPGFNGLVDPATTANRGWFGTPGYPADNLLFDTAAIHTYRAAFRIRAQPDSIENDLGILVPNPIKRDSIRVSVTPVCKYCKTPPPALVPFQNNVLTGNVGRAWDTTKPFYGTEFEIRTVENGGFGSLPRPDAESVPDWICPDAVLGLSFEPKSGPIIDNNWWRLGALDSMYNVSTLSYIYPSPRLGETGITHAGPIPGVAPFAVVGTAVGNVNYLDYTLQSGPDFRNDDSARVWRSFTTANHCFRRQRPTSITLSGVDENNNFIMSPADSVWHHIISFTVRRPARAPEIFDSILGRVLRHEGANPDTIFLCRNRLIDSLGSGFFGSAISNAQDFILRYPNVFYPLEKNPTGVDLTLTVPSDQYHGTASGEYSGNIHLDFESFDDVGNTEGFEQQTKVTIRVHNPNAPEGPGLLAFAAQDACGRGDSVVIAYYIMDTVSADPNVMYHVDGAFEQAEPWEDMDTIPCAYTSMRFWVQNYFNTETTERSNTCWWYNDDAITSGISSTIVIPGQEHSRLVYTFPVTPGHLMVNRFNRCGGSTRVASPYLVPIPYYKAQWVEPFPDTICQGEEYVFKLDSIQESTRDSLFVLFPYTSNTAHWTVLGNTVSGYNRWRPSGKGNQDTILMSQLFPPLIEHTINAEAVGNGTISPSGDTVVKEGDNIAFYFEPDPGYYVLSVTINGETVTDLSEGYNFINVSGPIHIVVAFHNQGTPPVLQPFVPVAPLPPRTSGELEFVVRVGDSIGGPQDILIQWEAVTCLGRRPAHWDTTRIFTSTQPLAPQFLPSLDLEQLNDTVCARTEIWLSVQPAPKDTAQNNYYVWTFPSEDWIVLDTGSNKTRVDSVFVQVGHQVLDVDTVYVKAMSGECPDEDRDLETLTEGASLFKIPLVVWDTVVFDMDLILDAAREDAAFGNKPCKDSELLLFIPKPYSVDSIRWTWSDDSIGVFEGYDADFPPMADDVIFGGWEFTQPDLFPDTFAFTPTDYPDTFYIQVTMFNQCGPSHSPVIQMRVAEDISGKPLLFLDHPYGFTSELCEGDTVPYGVVPLDDADQYVWHFPWEIAPDKTFDTVRESSRWVAPPREAEGETIYIYAINNCSQSDTTALDSIILTIRPAPEAPVPSFGVWGTGEWDGWLLDTICMRQNSDIWEIALDPDDGIFDYGEPDNNWDQFQWTQLGGDTMPTLDDLLDFPALGRDEVFVRALTTPGGRRYSTQIGVAARLNGCTVSGKMLKILLTSVDTIPTERLGQIVPSPSWAPLGGFSGYTPCPGSTYTFQVQRDSAFAYRWFLPDTTYKFVDSSTGPSVEVVIGKNPSRIGLITTTGDLCTENEGRDTLWTELITPYPAPIIEFLELSHDTICENDELTVTATFRDDGHTALPDSVRWIFPSGWLAGEKTDTVTESNIITIKAPSDGGIIRVSGIQYCGDDELINEGELLDTVIHVLKMPDIKIIGDTLPCVGVPYVYTMEPNDPRIEFSVNFDAPGAIVVTLDPNKSYEVTFETSDAFVRFTFSNISFDRCPDLKRVDYSKPINVAVLDPLDLILNDRGQGAKRADTVCIGETKIYIARDLDSNAKEFVWTIPPAWETDAVIEITGDLKDTLHITFNQDMATYGTLGILELRGITRCDDDTMVYRQEIFIDTIPLPSPVLDARKDDMPFFTKACGTDTIVLFIRPNPRYDNIFWTWNGDTDIPDTELQPEIGNDWRLYDTAQARRGDTLALIVPEALTPPDNTLDIAVTINNIQCGPRTYEFTLLPSDTIREQPMFIDPITTVCADEDIDFAVTPISNAEMYYWNFDWQYEVDTLNSAEHSFVVPQEGEIWVVPANGCGPGLISSDTVTIEGIFARPKMVLPVNFTLDGSIGRDTACLRSDHTLEVMKNPAEDTVDVTFQWFYMDGDSISPLSGTSATFTINADLTTDKLGKRTTIGVTAIRDGCNLPGDTLKIEMVLVDTIPMDWLGTIKHFIDDTAVAISDGMYCPQDTIILGVADVDTLYDWAKPIYGWVSLDSTWQIIGDTTESQIKVVVGTNPGVFSVNVFTGFSCDVENRQPLLSDTLHLAPRPILDGFLLDFPAQLCAETDGLITVFPDPESIVDAYEFIIHQRKLYSTEFDTIHEIQSGSTYTYTPDEGLYDSIFFEVIAIDNSTCTSPRLSDTLRGEFVVLNSPLLHLIGDMAPCRDSSVIYLLIPSDEYVTFDWNQSLLEMPNIAAPGVDLSTSEYPNGGYPDTLYVSFFGDSLEINLWGIEHEKCDNFAPVNIRYPIYAGITPNIPIEIVPDVLTACMGDTLIFVAQLIEPVMFAVNYIWELPRPNTADVLTSWTRVNQWGPSNDTIKVVV
ncbi:MAG: hypothetical protein FWG79_05745, partial [Bacteroidales bacterium]|nr:hypothetical protein [Bacteroidales bacterium]